MLENHGINREKTAAHNKRLTSCAILFSEFCNSCAFADLMRSNSFTECSYSVHGEGGGGEEGGCVRVCVQVCHSVCVHASVVCMCP